MSEEQFTKAEVDYLIAAAKFIKGMPTPLVVGSPPKAIRLVAEVFKKSEPGRPVKGLLVMARARQSPSGISNPPVSSALEWHGKRIRGLNFELWHDKPDGSTVKGWHEHLWSPEYQDCYVVLARPKPTCKGLSDIFKWSLKKWNIKIMGSQQGELAFGK